MQENRFTLILMMLFAMIFWGGGWTANKLIVDSGEIIVLSFWRFAITFLTLIPLLLVMRRSIRVSYRAIRISFVSALFNLSFMIAAFLGVMCGTAGRAGVVITTLTPLMTFGLMALFFSSTITGRQGFGLFLGFVGGMVMLQLWEHSLSGLLVSGNLYLLAAALLWSFVTLFSQRSHLHMDPLVYSFIVSGFASLILFLLALPYDLWFVFDEGVLFWSAMIYISFFGQTIATTIYYYASGKLGSGSASSFMFIVPLSALLISWLVLGEIPGDELLIGGGISIFAVYLINKKRSDS